MKYLLLVSHGDFATGLKQTLSMFAGKTASTIIAIGLRPDEAAAGLEIRFEDVLQTLPYDASFVVLADIIGGSPLTTVCKVLGRHGKLAATLVLGGMNFSMALTALMNKDTLGNSDLKAKVLAEAAAAIKEFKLPQTETTDEEEI